MVPVPLVKPKIVHQRINVNVSQIHAAIEKYIQRQELANHVVIMKERKKITHVDLTRAKGEKG